ncbi:MAG: L,D-transpeptidase [Actinomycetota bacterium]|nr:L,D-transpeptidase [Actinomycetota bacterium]
MRTHRTFTIALLLAPTLALGACGGSSDASETPAPEPLTTTTADQLEPAVVEPVDGIVAGTDTDLAVYGAIGDTTPAQMLPARTEFGSRRVLRVVGRYGTDDGWLEVLLPVRPNGSRGFVRAADVTLESTNLTVDIDLATKVLRVSDGDNGVLVETPIAIGSAENPTPTGDFYLTDILITGDEDSAYGPYALGLSAHSETLSEFGGGDGQIGIHGTNQPSSIGRAVSHGCVRVSNDIVTALANTVPLGTPVVIH